MLFRSSSILFSTAFIVQSVICLTLPTEFLKESSPSQLSSKEQSSTLPFHDDETNSQENLKQAATHARELIQFRSQGVGTLMSTFSKDHAVESLQGLPIGLQEYFAPFPNGDLLLLSLPISNIYHNIELDPNHSATLSIKDELASIQRKSSLWSANWRRISLFGKLEPITNINEAKELYEKFHPDSTLWDRNQDGSPHESHWVRFKVEKVFYFGGFGDRGAIGWLDMNIYRNNFENTPEVEDRSRCFHPEGQNLYCDQPNLGPEINEIEEGESVKEFQGDQEEYEIEFSFDGDEDEDEGEDEEEEEYEDNSEEDLENLMDLWEETDEPVITQIINNNYITHHHHHHYRTAVSSSIERSPFASNEIIEAIEDASLTEMREELMEMTDELMEIADEMIEEKEEEEEEYSDEIFSKQEEKLESKEEETNDQKEVEATEDMDIPMIDKVFESMGLLPLLDGLLDLTQVDEDQNVDDQESAGVKFEVEI